ncbi:MAG: citrate synthase [Phormidesmis sp.]
MTTCDYKPGLEGIPATQSGISYVDGQNGILEYRGIRIEEIAQQSTFLETAYLLIWGGLPTQQELQDFEHEVQYHRRLKYRIRDMMKCFPESGHPMDALQACAAALGLFHSRRELEDPAYVQDAVVRLLAKIPTMVAAFKMMRKGNDPVQPRDDLDYSANFLYMLNERKPDPLSARIFDVCLVLHAEHTINASTFSAMVTASTLTDPYAVVASAVGTLAGPLHGGANEEVIAMLKEIGSVENVRPYIEKRIANREKIMGFGHRVYKVKDPRAAILQKLVEQLFDKEGRDAYYDIALELELVVEEKLGHKGVYPNVDFYSGLVYRKLGIPTDLFTPIFAIARVAGWLAHWKEQIGKNRIFRPTQIYEGPHQQHYVPLDKRVHLWEKGNQKI